MSFRNQHPLRAGYLFLGALGLILLLAAAINVSFGLPFNVSLGLPPSRDYTVKATFTDANGVVRGADVLIGGHPVGQVLGVDAAGQDAVVTMRVQQAFAPLHRGSVARIRYSTLLAQKFIELTPAAGGEVIPDGGAMTVDETVTPTDFDQFLGALDAQTRAQVQVLIQQAGDSVAGRQAVINDLLAQLHSLAVESEPGLGTFQAHASDVGTITANMATLSNRLVTSRSHLGDLVATAATTTGTLAANDQGLNGLILHLGNVEGDFNQTLSGEEPNLHTTVVSLDPLSGQLDTTVTIVNGDFHPKLGDFKIGIQLLTDEIGSAINQSDPNGNYLRQYFVNSQGCDSINSTYNSSCPSDLSFGSSGQGGTTGAASRSRPPAGKPAGPPPGLLPPWLQNLLGNLP
ncbi:MAG: MlaD family protein [Candidatus Dormibacteria bacterium]